MPTILLHARLSLCLYLMVLAHMTDRLEQWNISAAGFNMADEARVSLMAVWLNYHNTFVRAVSFK